MSRQTPGLGRPLLVPIDVLDGKRAPPLAGTLGSVPVILLGYHVVSEGTAPGRARLQFAERGRARLDDLRASLAATDVETRLVFTHDAPATIERVAAEEGAGSILLDRPSTPVDSVLAAVTPAVDLDRIADAVASLAADTDRSVTVYHAAGSRTGAEAAAPVLQGVVDRLVDRGVDEAVVSLRIDVTEAPATEVGSLADGSEFVVVGERDRTSLHRVFGSRDAGAPPTLVVRRVARD